MLPPIPDSWLPVLGGERDKEYYQKLEAFVDQERAQYEVFPPHDDVYNALTYTPFENVKAVLIGQDPYHDNGQAHGLCFSVRPGVRKPPSLVNIFKELNGDLGCPVPNNGYLAPWAEQGVLMLNTVLTVRAHQANSHKGKGWEKFTDRVIEAVGHRDQPVVFILWGSPAQKKKSLIDLSRHTVVESVHPSPLSAAGGFFGSKPFSQVNTALQSFGVPPINWCIPNL